MRITYRTRRTTALLAASTLGCSALVLGAAGVASATVAPAPITDADDYSVTSDDAGSPATVTVDNGFCAAYIDVIGGEGGANGASQKGPADEVTALIPVQPTQVYTFQVGGAASGGNPYRPSLSRRPWRRRFYFARVASGIESCPTRTAKGGRPRTRHNQ